MDVYNSTKFNLRSNMRHVEFVFHYCKLCPHIWHTMENVVMRPWSHRTLSLLTIQEGGGTTCEVGYEDMDQIIGIHFPFGFW